jgi:hypothetical protein
MKEELGALVQAYAGAKWGERSDKAEAARLGALLDPDLRDRIDTLGGDCERLLRIPDTEVMRRLGALEEEAHREDASMRARAGRVRSTEEAIIGGTPQQANGQARGPGRQRNWSGRQQRRTPR